jgi:hypothetical protein
MLADEYSEAVQGHCGKKGRMERGSKMFGTINHLACQLVEGRLEGGMISAHHYPSLFPLFIPQA